MTMEFFDAHVHFLWSEAFGEIRPKWQTLVEKGLKGIAGIIKAHPPREREKYLALIPVAYHDLVDSRFMGERLDSQLSTAKQLGDITVFPYLDCRFIRKEDSDLTRLRETGFRGLKVLYIPEEDQELGIVGWERFFGRSKIESEKVVGQMIEQAVSFNWPIIFHANLRKYGGFVKEILQAFKSHPFIIPHFGFSRKLIAQFLERFDFCYTDFSSLLPFMQDNPQSYLNFITVFQNRILFGTDTALAQPDLINEYLEFVLNVIKDNEVQKKVLANNYRSIHC